MDQDFKINNMNTHINVKFKKLHPLATIPKMSNPFDGAYDVTATRVEFPTPDQAICYLDIATEFDHPYRLRAIPRSSITNSHWVLQNSPGMIESNYRHGIQLRFRAFPIGIKTKFDHILETLTSELVYPKFSYKVGERLGQIYFDEIIHANWNEVQPFYTDEEVLTYLEEQGYQKGELEEEFFTIAQKEGFEFCPEFEDTGNYWRNYRDDDLDYANDRGGGFGSSGL